MADNHSKERIQAEAAFAKMQNRSGCKASEGAAVSAADQNTARLKAARLERDAACCQGGVEKAMTREDGREPLPEHLIAKGYLK